MSNTEPEDPTTETVGLDADVLQRATPDWLLRMLVRLIERHDENSMGVTLNVAGAAITGTLVSRSRWLKELAKEGGTLATLVEGVQEALAAFEKPEQDQSEQDDDSDSGTVYNYLHLLDAHIISGGQATIPTGDGMHWRGRLSEVAGFSVGSIGSS